jgi:hypothetical protein
VGSLLKIPCVSVYTVKYTLISDGITGIVLVRVVWVVKYILLLERERR